VNRQFRDPVTGDPLTLGEHLSWLMQGIIRRWAFLGLITVATIVVWSVNDATGLLWWNLGASYLALLIEGTVGIAMFSQTRRDAVIIRHLRDVVDALDGAGHQRNAADARRDELIASVRQMEQEQGRMLRELHILTSELYETTCKPSKRRSAPTASRAPS
jgi:hypothetical protein